MGFDRERIPDVWEQRYGLVPGERPRDNDADGMDDLSEDPSGTDPTDAASLLKAALCLGQSPNGLTLSWPVAPGRTYQIQSTDEPDGNSWSTAAGPWLASTNQSVMTWAVTNSVRSHFYRVKLLPPDASP